MMWNKVMEAVIFVLVGAKFAVGVPSKNRDIDGDLPPNYFLKEPNMVHEICETEMFQGACAQDEVMIITEAMFGRMHQGRCIPQYDTAPTDCVTDVRNVADKLCSGKQQCQIQMPNEAIVAENPCQALVRVYLQIQYKCQQVFTDTQQDCYLPMSVHIDREVTTISSSLMINRGCEVLNLQADPGQTLQLSIVDFMADEEAGEGCDVKYGELVTTAEDNAKKHVEICQGEERERSLYESLENEVQLILDRDASKQDHHCLIQISALGCKNIPPPQGTWVRREGDKMVIGCHGNQQQTWHLTCENQRWEGVIGTCTMEASTTASPDAVAKTTEEPAQFEITERLLIFTVGCFSLFLAVTIVTLGVVCLKKIKLRERDVVRQMEMHTMRCQPLKTAGTLPEPTYAVYDRIPWNGQENSRGETNTLLPGFDESGRPLV